MVQSRQYFSEVHLNAAVEMANMLYRGPSQQQSSAFAVSVIFLSVAFLEAKINELLADVTESGDNPIDRGRLGEVSRLLATGPVIDDKSYAPQKYQLTLDRCNRQQFDERADPYDSATLVIRVRNRFVHYRPTWKSSNQPLDLDTALKAKLQDSFFLHVTPEGYWSDVIGGFPHACLTHDFALWTVRACVSFVDDFFARMGPLLDGWVWASRERLAKQISRLDPAAS